MITSNFIAILAAILTAVGVTGGAVAAYYRMKDRLDDDIKNLDVKIDRNLKGIYQQVNDLKEKVDIITAASLCAYETNPNINSKLVANALESSEWQPEDFLTDEYFESQEDA